MMSFYSRRWVVLALVSGIAGSAAGCTGAQTASGKASSPSPVHVAVEPLSEEQFVQQVATLLKEGDHDPDRLRELGAVVHHTLSRAGHYFERGLEDQALQTVMGAFFLVRSGELHPKTLQGQGTVLLQAADAAARRGDEGRARAWYELVRECGDGATAKRAGEHIQALSQWEADTRRDGSMQSVSAQRLAAMKRALVRRDAQSVEQAREAVVTWVERAVEASQNDEPIQSIFDHDERMAARLAFIAGAQNMIALYLRDGDAGGALAALNTDTMAAVTEPRWMTGLIAAAEGNGEAWLDWFRRFQAAVEQPELFDPDVARGALWGSAVELYRAQPNSLGATLPVASLLVEHGMADVAPLLLVSAYDEGKEKPDTDAQEKQMVERQALRLLFEALLRSERNEDLPLARRVFDNAAPIIDRYQAPTDSQGPAAVDFYELMGSLETRAGHLDRAYTHLERAVELRPSIESFRLLSSIERHREEYKPALATLERLLALAEAERLPLATVQGLLMSYDVLLDQGQAEVAPRFLEKALQELLALRQHSSTPRIAAAIERNLAEVLERYGQLDAARRASERARDASLSDGAQLTNVLLDESRRALTFGDLAHGRLALRHALEANLEDSALVYAALWQRLLELRVNAASDGTVEEALSRVAGSDGWVAALRDWGLGDLSDAALLGRAETAVQRVEARFYASMRRHFQQQTEDSRAALQAIAASPTIELIEVRIARDLTSAGAATGTQPALPAGVTLP